MTRGTTYGAARMRRATAAGILSVALAAAVTGIYNAPVAEAASPTARDYTVGPINPSTSSMATTPTDLLALPALDMTMQSSNVMAAPMGGRAYVLKGDNVTYLGAVTGNQSDSGLGLAPVSGNEGRWSPKPGFYGIDPAATTQPGVTESSFSWTQMGTDCATLAPSLNGTTLNNAWCMGVALFQVEVTNAQPVNTADYSVAGRIGTGTGPYLAPLSAVNIGGPDNPILGANATAGGMLHVLDPQLRLIKEVCSTGSGCALADDPAQFTVDSNGNITYTENGGTWVKSQQIAVGSTEVQWRLTAVNTGNITIDNVHTARDLLTPAAGDEGVTGPSDSCQALDFGSLAPGATVSAECLTSLSGDLSGRLTNTATLNGDFPDTIVDPEGTPLIDRFEGNPTPGDPSGEPSMVASNEDSAVVFQPYPEITIVKYDTLDGDDATSGDYNTSPGKQLSADTETPISFLVTNSGQEPLVDIEVTDVTTSGQGDLRDVSCDFSPLGGPASGTTWAGPFAIGDSFTCTGVLPGLAAGATHVDTATVTATGETSGVEVSDSDPWNAHVPAATGPLAVTGSNPAGLIALGSGLALVGGLAVALTLRHRRRVTSLS